jgi:hypothetical protein
MADWSFAKAGSREFTPAKTFIEKTNFPSFLDELEWHPPIIHIVDKKSRID